MTPQEQQLISQLFERLKAAPRQAKDADADALIRRGVAEQPDAPYLLTQTVLIQDMALANAQARIAELEQQVEAAKAAPPAAPTSFLGSLLGRGSVPAAGARQPQAPQQPQQPMAQPQPAPAWGVAPQPMMGSPWGGGGGSGFLRSAAATALGVAGGELLFQGVRSMFGSSFGGGYGIAQQPSISETVVNNYYGDDSGSGQSQADYASGSGSDTDNVVPADYDPGQDSGQDYGDSGADFSDSGSDFGGDDSTSI